MTRTPDWPTSTANWYRTFAREAEGRSPSYQSLSLAVAEDVGILEFLDSLPEAKRLPNLLFGAIRYLTGDPSIESIGDVRRFTAKHSSELRDVMLARRTQTNEPARCATLLPALARNAEPLALIEVGASAGLTLLPDRYGYDFGDVTIPADDVDAPVLSCSIDGAPLVPRRAPEVCWRAGIDLNPLDISDDDDVRWLSALIWPEQWLRRERLEAAVAVARKDAPRIVRGDLLNDLPALVAEAPSDATVVVYHSAVLAYVDIDKRRAFADLVASLGVRWLSNEGVRVLPWVDVPVLDDAGSFVLIEDGRTPLAFTDPHGAALTWL